MKQITALVKKYLDDRNWNHLEPTNLAKSISIEAAELLEVFQWKNYSVEQLKSKKELEERVKKEMADVMIYCIELAIHLRVDLEEVIKNKITYNSEKYPAEEIMKHKGENHDESFYMKRKLEYRKIVKKG